MPKRNSRHTKLTMARKRSSKASAGQNAARGPAAGRGFKPKGPKPVFEPYSEGRQKRAANSSRRQAQM